MASLLKPLLRGFFILVFISAPAAALAVEIVEIIVTTQKREQTLKDVPVAVTAFGGDRIQQSDIEDVRGLVDFTPGFTGRTEDSFIDALSIRGIATNDYGIGGDPSVAVFTDGVWSGRNGGVQMAFYDIERVEVVKGPQATLFGRNAVAGAISIITRKPVDEFEGHINATLAEFDERELTGTLNIPLNGNWFFRGSALYKENDGYLKNLAGGDDLGFHELSSTRLALRYLGKVADVTYTLGYEDRKQDPSIYWDPELGLPKDRVNTDLADQGKDESNIFYLTINAEWDLGNSYSLASITGYKTYRFTYLEDYDAGPQLINNYLQDNEVDYVSQEIRLNFEGEGPVTWFVGASYYREKIDGVFAQFYDEDALCAAVSRTDADDFIGPAAGCDDPNFEDYWGEDIDPADILANKSEYNFMNVDAWGWAAYAEMAWQLTPAVVLTLGARYTYDEKEAENAVPDSGGALFNNFEFEFFTDGFLRDKDHWNEFTPRVALNWDVTDAVTLYASYATGYKTGGFATFGFAHPNGLVTDFVDDDGMADAATVPLMFDPETVDSYELGLKSRLFENRMQLNMAYFNYQYDDLQLSYFDDGSSLVSNIGEAEGQGIELDARWLPTERLDFFVTAAWLDTEITKADDIIALGACSACEGRDLPLAPEYSASLIASYTLPVQAGNLVFTVEQVYQDKMYSDPDNIEAIAVDSWQETALRLAYASDDKWRLTLWVKNLFDEEYFERGWANAEPDNSFGYGLTNTLVWPSKPRTVGLSFGMDF